MSCTVLRLSSRDADSSFSSLEITNRLHIPSQLGWVIAELLCVIKRRCHHSNVPLLIEQNLLTPEGVIGSSGNFIHFLWTELEGFKDSSQGRELVPAQNLLVLASRWVSPAFPLTLQTHTSPSTYVALKPVQHWATERNR